MDTYYIDFLLLAFACEQAIMRMERTSFVTALLALDSTSFRGEKPPPTRSANAWRLWILIDFKDFAKMLPSGAIVVARGTGER